MDKEDDGGTMKILMTTDNIGDAWNYSTDLAITLRKQGYNITLAIFGKALSPQQKRELDGIAYFNLECKLEWMNNPWADMQIAKEWLLKITKILQPDILHMNTYATGNPDTNIPVIVNINFLASNRLKALMNKKNYTDMKLYEDKIARTLQEAHIVIAPDHSMLKELETHFGNFNKKRIIYCGKEKSVFRKSLRYKDPTKQKSFEVYNRSKMRTEYIKLYNTIRGQGNKFILYSIHSN